ncbi:MAG: hypothetical protein EBU88_15060, partial [Acidobacteria bacterium]|nr:hypothetical protein [Acidobacteriota bacterium]
MFRTAIFILAAVASSFVTRWLVDAPSWLRSIDYPNQRSSHARPTPRSGGIGIVATFVLLLPLLWVMLLPDATNWRFAFRFGLALCGYIVIAIVGLVDDMRTINPLAKYIGQLVAALIAIWSGVTFNFLDLPFVGRLDLSMVGPLTGLLGAVLTVIWLTGFSNLFNFMDGIDGIAGGSASGKTHFLNCLIKQFSAESICLVSLDNYYLSKDKLPVDSNGVTNFDVPESIDVDLFCQHIKELSQGKSISQKEYT